MKKHLLLLAILFNLSSAQAAPIQATVSIYAVNTKTGTIVMDQASHLSLIPASTLKLSTTAAALELLGADHNFETHLEYDGNLDKKGVLRGNLYIRGGGDPTLGSNRIEGSLGWKELIQSWADAASAKGIRKVQGRVIPDASAWERALAVPSWCWEDLGNYYGAGACALSFHENAYTLTFQPGQSVGDSTSVLRTDPPLPELDIRNEVTTGPVGSGDGACIYGTEFVQTQFVRGTVPAGVKEFSIRGFIPNPPKLCGQALQVALKHKGITVKGEELEKQSKRVVLHTTHSPKVAEIARPTNQKSINLYAEHLLKKMGEQHAGLGSTVNGIEAVTQLWRGKGIDLMGACMVDGSGLSRKNLMTTKQMAQILSEAKKSDAFSHFKASLTKRGAALGKSGSMSQIRCFAGYVDEIAFAIFINHSTDTKAANRLIDETISVLENRSIDPAL